MESGLSWQTRGLRRGGEAESSAVRTAGGHYLIQDPDHEYAVAFIRHLHRTYGLSAICFYLQGKTSHYRRREYPALFGEGIAASFEVRPGDVVAFARFAQQRFGPLRGVIPYAEPTVQVAATIDATLQLGWNAPGVVARFGDKAALKAWLRERHPELRMNRTWKLPDAAGMLSLGDELPEVWVLKPNDGYASHHVLVGRGRPTLSALQAQQARASGAGWILEEFVSGQLYTVDGLIDAEGNVAIVGVFASTRQRANGAEVVYGSGWSIHQDEDPYAALADYAQAVVRALGLRRSPFHLEAVVDERGPCLIEVGARLVGHTHAWTLATLHGPRFDFIDAAARQYLFREPLGELGLDPARYDAQRALKVYGVSRERGRIYSLEGVGEVERMPEFNRWIVEPKVGAPLVPTLDLTTVPYSAVLLGAGPPENLRERGEEVYRLVRWNREAGLRCRARVEGQNLARRAVRKVWWLGTQARRQARAALSRSAPFQSMDT